MSIKIITDSSSDYTQEEAEQLGITVIPLTLTIDDQDYYDGINITKDEFYNLLINKKKFPKTSQPTPEVFKKYFKEAKDNNDTLLVLPISSGMSGAYNSALMAKQLVDYDNIYIIDTKTTIGGLRILVTEALKLIEKGFPIEEIVKKLEHLKKRIVLVAIMNTLEYLHKGGRLSSISAAIGSMLNIKPIITFINGKVEVLSKPLGKLRAAHAFIKQVISKPIDPNYLITYHYSYNKQNLDETILNLKKHNLYYEGPKINLSPVVGCHIGDNAVAMMYVEKE